MPICFPHFSVLFFLLLLAVSPAAAQPSSTDPQDPNFNSNINPSVGVVIIALVVSLFLLGFFSMYIRHCAGDSSSSSSANAATRLATAARSRRAPRGLDAAVIESFPTFDYSSVKSLHIGKGALECAVCLNEFEDDETLRLIPKCDHVFHPECIDAWLVSHTTCPVCRADLTPQPNDATQLAQIDEAQPQQNQPSPNNDSIIDILPSEPVPSETELMDIPLNPAALPPLNPKLNRSRTRAPGRPRWLGKFARSNSTGHVAVKQWENMDRFTLRLPEDIRRQIMSGKLNRTTSCVALPREGSSRRGPRAGPPIPDPLPMGEGSSRGRLFGSWRFDRAARSDRWMFSLAPPFVSRAPSVRSPKVAASDGGSVHSSKAGDSVHVFTVADPNLPPV